MVLFTQNILSHVCIKILRSKIINSKVTSLSMCVFSCYHRIFIKNGLKTNISTSIFDSRYCWVHWKNSTTLLTLKIHDFKLQIDHNKVWSINILVIESDTASHLQLWCAIRMFYTLSTRNQRYKIISLFSNEDVKHQIETEYIHIMHICIPPAFHYIYVNTCSKVIPNQSFSLLLSSENKPHNGITSRIRSRQKMQCCNITVNLV